MAALIRVCADASRVMISSLDAGRQ